MVCGVAGGANTACQAADKAGVAADALHVETATAAEAGTYAARGAGREASGALRDDACGQKGNGCEGDAVHCVA